MSGTPGTGTGASGRVVVVSGGSRGLGAGIVQAYLDNGDLVATCARSRTPEIDKWEGEAPDRFLFTEADLSKIDDNKRFVGDRIHFVGRRTEIINVGGAKVHPLPIEERIGAVPGVAVARVWGRPNPMTGAIVAVDLVLTDDADPDRTRMAVREACLDLPGAAQPRSIRIVEDIATKGSKIVRQA